MGMISEKMSVDEELKKAFTELQLKMVDTRQQLMASDLEVKKFEKAQQHTDIVIKDVACLSKDTRLFYSIGRMYLHEDNAKLMKLLQSKKKFVCDKIQELADNQESLRKDLKEAENNLREMVEAKRRN